jgi:hypothetical protein
MKKKISEIYPLIGLGSEASAKNQKVKYMQALKKSF